MGVVRWNRVLGGLAALLAIAPVARAQQNSPTIGYVYPAGGKQGGTVQVTVGGQFLQGTKTAYVSGPGASVKVVEYVGPIPQRQLEDLREQVKELQQRKQAARPAGRLRAAASQATTRPAWTDEDEKTLTRIVERLETFARNRAVPAFAETVTLEVTIAADARCGCRELRLEAASGLSNPMVFCVGKLAEFAEPVAKGTARFGIGDERVGRRPLRRSEPAESQTDITLPAVVNGQILAGDRDRYRFTARKGRRLIVAVQARRLVPYMADAVPGWFQALVTLYDAKGEEVACADHYRFDPDPVIACEIPADGQYEVEITDALFRGREDFVYRISIGELPLVTSIFPLGGPAGALTNVQLTGWNLPRTRLAVSGKDKSPGVYPLPDGPESLLPNLSYAIDDLPECLEREPNNDPATAQPVTLPVIVNGRIELPGALDVFRFEGHAGETIVAEVLARRLGSPLDSAIRITDAEGKQLAYNDDFTDKAVGLMTHHADSWLLLKLPADGTYYVYLCDVQRKGGPEYGYRLRISGPRPDFDLRMTPSSINIRGGETVPATVHAIRRDGFAGEIMLSLKDAPEGFTLGGAAVPDGQDQVRITLTAPRAMPNQPVAMQVEGHAKIGGREIVHKVVPADDMMQAFAYRHLVPAEQMQICPSTRPFPRGSASLLSQIPIKIAPGGGSVLEVAVPSGPMMGTASLELNEAPEGIRIDKTIATGTGLRIVLACDAAKVKRGLKGNLIFSAYTERSGGEGKQAGKRRMPLGVLPAVPFEVVGGP